MLFAQQSVPLVSATVRGMLRLNDSVSGNPIRKYPEERRFLEAFREGSQVS
jgi:hypothetical protein